MTVCVRCCLRPARPPAERLHRLGRHRPGALRRRRTMHRRPRRCCSSRPPRRLYLRRDGLERLLRRRAGPPRAAVPAAAVRAGVTVRRGAGSASVVAGRRLAVARPWPAGVPTASTLSRRHRRPAGRRHPALRRLAEADAGRPARHGRVPVPERAARLLRRRRRRRSMDAAAAPRRRRRRLHRRRDLVRPHRGGRSDPAQLRRAAAVMARGAGCSALPLPLHLPEGTASPSASRTCSSAFGFFVGLPAARAWSKPEPARVQAAVKRASSGSSSSTPCWPPRSSAGRAAAPCAVAAGAAARKMGLLDLTATEADAMLRIKLLLRVTDRRRRCCWPLPSPRGADADDDRAGPAVHRGPRGEGAAAGDRRRPGLVGRQHLRQGRGLQAEGRGPEPASTRPSPTQGRFAELKALKDARGRDRRPDRSPAPIDVLYLQYLEKQVDPGAAQEDHREGQRGREGVQRLPGQGGRQGDDRQRGPQGAQGRRTTPTAGRRSGRRARASARSSRRTCKELVELRNEAATQARLQELPRDAALPQRAGRRRAAQAVRRARRADARAVPRRRRRRSTRELAERLRRQGRAS